MTKSRLSRADNEIQTLVSFMLGSISCYSLCQSGNDDNGDGDDDDHGFDMGEVDGFRHGSRKASSTAERNEYFLSRECKHR